MSGEETVREEAVLCSDKARRIALRDNIRDAQAAMASAGFAVADSTSPWDMVTHILARNADQKKLEDALRERLKAVDAVLTVEVELISGKACPFWRESGACKARAGYAHCDKHGEPDSRHALRERPPCRLDEGPILVKKSEEDSGSEGNRGREATTAPCPGGDRSKDPERPR
jgi:hypothetical protein